MWWQFQRISEKTAQLGGKICCVRCKSRYPKEHADCPFCKNLSESELTAALQGRKEFRKSLGKIMMIGAILFFMAVLALGKLMS